MLSGSNPSFSLKQNFWMVYFCFFEWYSLMSRYTRSLSHRFSRYNLGKQEVHPRTTLDRELEGGEGDVTDHRRSWMQRSSPPWRCRCRWQGSEIQDGVRWCHSPVVVVAVKTGGASRRFSMVLSIGLGLGCRWGKTVAAVEPRTECPGPHLFFIALRTGPTSHVLGWAPLIRAWGQGSGSRWANLVGDQPNILPLISTYTFKLYT
jgi:hypothetical protein